MAFLTPILCIVLFGAVLRLTDPALPGRMALPLGLAGAGSLSAQLVYAGTQGSSTSLVFQMCVGLVTFIAVFLLLASGQYRTLAAERIVRAQIARQLADLETALRLQAPGLALEAESTGVSPVPQPHPAAVEVAGTIGPEAGPFGQALKALAERSYEGAVRLLEDPAVTQTIAPERIQLARARLSAYLGRYTEAAEALLRLTGTDSPSPDLLEEAGAAVFLVGDHPRAQTVFQRALEMREAAGNRRDVRVIRTLCTLARLNIHRDHLEQAETYLTRAARLTEGAPDTWREVRAGIHEQLGQLHQRRSKHDPAKRAFREALSEWEQARGKFDPRLTTCLKPLATLYTGSGDLDQAETYLHQALVIDKQVYGNDSLAVGEDLFDIGELHQRRQNHLKALDYYERVLRIREAQLSSEDERLTRVRRNLITVYRALEKYDLAVLISRTLVADLEAHFGQTHVELVEDLQNLGEISVKLRRFEDAESCWQQVLRIQRRNMEVYSVEDIAKSLEAFAMMLRKAGRQAEALDREREAEALREGHGLSSAASS